MAKIPKGYSNIIFCRMNPSASANNWNNKWNQSSDLTIPTNGNNLYTVSEGAWDKGGGSWSKSNHEYSVVENAATCTDDGSKVYTCNCGDTYTKTISKLNHNMITDAAVSPTCTETGLTEGSHCSRCDDATTAQKVVDALGHNYGEDGKDATCGVCGHANPNACQHDWVDADCVLPKTCSKCGDTEGEPNGHEVLKHVDAVAATCEAPGNLEYWYCEACGMATTVEGQELNTPVARMVTGATGHDMADATCTAPSTCKNGCGLTVGSELGHSYTSSVTAPTCTAAGYTTYTCGACGDTYVADEVAKLGHDLVDVEGKDATCTEAGYTAYKDCSRCDHIEGKEEIPATGHNFVDDKCACGQDKYYTVYFRDDWNWGGNFTAYYWGSNVDNNPAWPGIGMTFVGTQNYTDGTSRNVYSAKIPYDITGLLFFNNKSEVVGDGKTPDITSGWDNCVVFYMFWENKNTVRHDAVYHTHTGVETSAPTCTEAGEKTYTCLCGDTYTEVIPATGHTERTPATCTAQAVCDVCGESYGELAAHEYFYPCDAHCMVCGNLTNEDASHTIKYVEAKAPTCTENGNVEYWYCSDCGSAWLDVDRTVVANQNSVKLGATCATNAVHTEGIEAGCHYTGLTEYWYCANCDVYYLDAACTIVTNYKNLVIPALQATAEYVPAKAATCDEDGNVEYWVCYDCEQVWADAALTQLTNIKNVQIAKGHTNGCGHYAADGDSLQAALNSGSVELTKPVHVSGDLVIAGGSVLNLNGQTLTADAIITFDGTIIDTTGKGKIIVKTDKFKISEGNYGYAPLHVETKDGISTYVITPVKVQGVTADLTNTAVVRPSLKGQYTNKDLFFNNVIDHGISFELLVTRTNGNVTESATLNFTEDQIKALYDDNTSAIKITLVGGLEGYTYTVALVVKSGTTMVHSTVVAIHYVPVTSTTEEDGETTNN